MGRKRTRDTDLPKRVHFKHGSFWYVERGKWKRLSTDRKEAIELGEALNGKVESRIAAEKWRRKVDRADRQGKKTKSLARRRSSDGLRVAERWAAKAYKVVLDRSRVKGLDMDMTPEDVMQLARSTRGVCQVSGIPFSEARPDGMFRRPWMPSIDRIDTTKGYIKSNCRIVCVAANLAMNDFGEAIFARLADNFARYNVAK